MAESASPLIALFACGLTIVLSATALAYAIAIHRRVSRSRSDPILWVEEPDERFPYWRR